LQGVETTLDEKDTPVDAVEADLQGICALLNGRDGTV
jgi:hypothetical protein